MSLSLRRKHRSSEFDEHVDNKRRRTDSDGAEIIVQPSTLRLSQNLSQLENGSGAGKISKLHLTNFMCHSNLKIDFHNRINFFVGSNGSGKSAILAAVVLGLGGKARTTNRATSIKNFIKTGENSAKIEITLSNHGIDAYEPENYGNEITIVRTFTSSSSTMVMKDFRGNVISRKSHDLQRLLMYHNIQVDNPCFLLNQDSSREFLKELQPKKNYILFLKATQIEMILEKLNECLAVHKDHVYQLKCRKKKLGLDENELEKMQDKLKTILSINELRTEIMRIECELFWKTVEDAEKDLNEFLPKINKVEERLEKLINLVNNREEIEKSCLDKINECQTNYNECANKQSKGREFHQSLLQLLTTNKNNLKEKRGDVDDYKHRISFFEEQLNDLNSAINEHRSSDYDEIIKERQRTENLIKEHENELNDIGKKIVDTKADIQKIYDKDLDLNEKISITKNKKSSIQLKIGQANSALSNIKKDDGNNVSYFGENAIKFLKIIDEYAKQNRFSETPLGPIGSFIEVPNAKYRNVIEYICNSILHAFIVNNTKDRLILDEILETHFTNYKPDIITTKFFKTLYTVKRCEPPQGTNLLYDEIKCNDPVVMNCIIDRIHVEKILLTDSKAIALQITSDSENVPHRLLRVIVTKPAIEVYPEPHYRIYSLNIKPAKLIKISVEDRLKVLNEELKDLKNNIERIDEELYQLQTNVKHNSKLIQERRNNINLLQKKRHDLTVQIGDLKSIEFPNSGQLEILQRELNDAEQRLSRTKEDLSKKTEELNKAIESTNVLEEQIKNSNENLKSLQTDLNKFKDLTDSLREKLRKLQQQFNNNEMGVKNLKNEKTTLEAEKENKLFIINEVTKKAQEKGARSKTTSTKEQLKENLRTTKSRLNMRREITDDPDDLKRKIDAMNVTLQNDISNFQNAREVVAKLKNSLLTRFDFVSKLKQHMGLILQFSFNRILKLRNYDGSISVDHDDKTLNVSVIPRDKHISSAVSNTKSLSGGERSFVTVAFLISLWSCVSHPFYFLDEYDVFTDEVNREYMSRLLINEGTERFNRQYAYLTPLDMSIDSGDIVKIHRMAPARK